MSVDINLTYEEAESLATKVFEANGVAEDIAAAVADALVKADADGQGGHGLSRVPSYVVQLKSGKVDGKGRPTLRRISASSACVDANRGFAYLALELAVRWLCDNAAEQGVSIVAIKRSHHCGVAGHPVEKLARCGLIGLMFANTPKAMAPPGSARALFGTNPIAFACPRPQADPLVIDLSLSVASRGKIKLAAERDESIPADWAVDGSGQATTDPHQALGGRLTPIGGEKGAALALMVEVIAAALTGSNFGYEASSFFDGDGNPPAVGQTLIAIAPERFNPEFPQRVENLFTEITREPGVRLPGVKRFGSRTRAMAEGMRYSRALIDELNQLSRNDSR